MEKIKNILKGNSLEIISDYIRLNKQIISILENNKNILDDSLKIAILASFTVNGIKDVLNVKCFKHDIISEIYETPYNQYNQEILNNESYLYKFNPKILFLLIDTASFFGDFIFFPYKYSSEERRKLIDEKFSEIISLIGKILSKLTCKIIMHNFEVPTYSPLGILESKQDFGYIEAIKTLNNRLIDYFKSSNQVFIFDFDEFCAKYGKNNIIDYRFYYIGDIKLSFDCFPKLCDQYLNYIKPLKAKIKKCIVLDLDNTLWGGIVGEDGIDGIKLGPYPEGRPFYEFQKYLLSLFNRGIILAINSKNNSSDALKVINEHPYMVLKEKYFSSIQINWLDKIVNLKEISKELNIGLDSMIFFDDDKFNREIVRKNLPEVYVVELPAEPSEYIITLMELNEFNVYELTDEDKIKGEIYQSQKKRQELQSKCIDLDCFISQLNMKITITQANNFILPRISQLIQKTNQFNTTSRRYSQEDIKNFSNDNNNFFIISVSVEDKFGDNGITGAMIIKKEMKFKLWIIDSFLLSCRILGRNIEKIILYYLIDEAKKDGIEKVIGEYKPNEKNIPAKDFYLNNGFKREKIENNIEIWSLNIVNFECVYPKDIQIIKE